MGNKKLDIWLENKLNEMNTDSSNKYIGFYNGDYNKKLKIILSTFQNKLNDLFEYLNFRLSYGHYTANESRELIKLIEDIEQFQSGSRRFYMDIQIDKYYEDIISKCRLFLSQSGGSAIPEDFVRIKIIDYDSIFTIKTQSYIEVKENKVGYKMKLVGEGSYAKVFKYKDENYNKIFALKRANKNLVTNELDRFKREFEEMKKMNSPYIVEVYNFDEEKYEYTMEFMDDTLEKYIHENNTKLRMKERVILVKQVLKSFKYIHSKGILHRDVSTKNILVKRYDDVVVLKVSDFGLVKVPKSDLTRKGTEIKGSLNDHKTLEIMGFENFKIEHETYALTKLIYFIMTGKSTLEKYNTNIYKDFVSKGISDRLSERYNSIDDLELGFNRLISQIPK